MWVRDIKIATHVDLKDRETLVLLRYYCAIVLKADSVGYWKFTPKELAEEAGYTVARWAEEDNRRVYESLLRIKEKVDSGEWDFISRVQIFIPAKAELTDKKTHGISGRAVFRAKYSERPWKIDDIIDATYCGVPTGEKKVISNDTYIWIDCRMLAAFFEACKRNPRKSDSKFAVLLAISNFAAISLKYTITEGVNKNALFIRGGRVSHSQIIALTGLPRSNVSKYIQWLVAKGVVSYEPGYSFEGGPWDLSYFVLTNIPEVRDLFVNEYKVLMTAKKKNNHREFKRTFPPGIHPYTDAYTPIIYPWEPFW